MELSQDPGMVQVGKEGRDHSVQTCARASLEAGIRSLLEFYIWPTGAYLKVSGEKKERHTNSLNYLGFDGSLLIISKSTQ